DRQGRRAVQGSAEVGRRAGHRRLTCRPRPARGRNDMNEPGRRILLGKVAGALGLRGEVKLESWTEPRSAIFRYQPWTLTDAQGREREISGVQGRETGKHVVATFPDVVDRDAADALRGLEIYVPRSALPPARPGEFYWADLEGLRVVTVEGVELGVVSHLFSTGANDVLVARDDERERMIPFDRPQSVTPIDFDTGVITGYWDADFERTATTMRIDATNQSP